MAYNTNTERLLNAIKSNTANITIDASGITVDNTALIAAIDAQDADITNTATNTGNTNTSVQALRGDNTSTGENTLYEIAVAAKAIQNTTETLQDVINAVNGQDADLSTTADNSNTSLGKNGCVMISGAAAQNTLSTTYAAIQFITNCTPTAFTIQASTTITNVEIPAGTIIYGDIRDITGDSNCLYILYKV